MRSISSSGVRVSSSTLAPRLSLRHLLEDPVNHTDVEMHMLVQTGTEAMNEGHCADVQGGFVHLGGTRAVSLQALCNDPQKDTQHHIQYCPITLHEISQ